MLAAGNVSAADLPRERLLMDFGWRFHPGDAPDAGTKFDYPEVTDLRNTRTNEIGLEGNLAANLPDPVVSNLGGDVSFVQTSFNDSGWRQLDLPHDWAVELPFDEQADLNHGFKPIGPGFPENSIGWYRRGFELPALDKGRTLWLEFDGVYRNSLVWLNGHCLGRHVSGYSGFRYDISQFANFGGKNELAVRVDASRFEGWFYEGAGIYRHVWLEKTSPLAIAPDGIFVYSQFENNVPGGSAEVHIQTKLLNSENSQAKAAVKCELFGPDGKSITFVNSGTSLVHVGESEFKLGVFLQDTGKYYPVLGKSWHESDPEAKWVLALSSPVLWSPESPNLYKLVTTVESGGQIVDRKETEFGIRTVAFDAEKGFLLNGKPYVIKGTCNHQDHAGVGAAMPDALQYFRVKKLKEMGCNAIRTSHNAPTPELLEACDRLGLLVMDENRRMDTNTCTLSELKTLILRDRNHPSVFIWSFGNEEKYIQGTEAGARVAAVMQDVVHKLDPTRLCTAAMNSGWGDGFSKVIDVQGCNYTWSGDPDKFRAEFPGKPMIGTETASTRSTRGIFDNDEERGYFSAYDLNTTHYLNVNGVHSNLTAEGWWKYYAARPFMSGVFNWTGFDYRGEPTPYKWPCISSHFGCIDTCGFPKDNFYYYQAWWSGQTVLHLLPHWNWPGNEGRGIEVWCYSNCKEVELFLNGKSLGKKAMPINGHLAWNVKYEPGTLSARGYDGAKVIAETKVETTGAAAAVQLAPDRPTINADGEDSSIINVSVTDARDRVVPVADNLVHFEISGPGKIIGVGNGDPSSHEADKASERKVFCGLAQVIVQTTPKAGEIKLTATAEGLKPATVAISSQPCTLRPSVP